MAFDDGWAALHLEAPSRVPRTEYSADFHWPLVRAVTGICVSQESDPQIQNQARAAFMRNWNYDFIWNTMIYNQIYGDFRTKMGHAEYLEGGVDINRDQDSPFSSIEQVLAFDPFDHYDSINLFEVAKAFEANYQALAEYIPSAVPSTGIYVTCISGLIEIFGWNWMLMALGIDPDGFGRVTNRYAAWLQQYFDALAQADVPIIMIHDDIVWTSGAFCHPEWMRQYVFPNYKRYFTPLIESGKKILYTSDGNYTQFIDDIAQTGVHGFVLEPCTDLKYLTEFYGQTHVIIGNADTRVLLSGTHEAIRSEVERCMILGKPCPGFFMAVGNHIPPNTPLENALYYQEIYEMLSRR